MTTPTREQCIAWASEAAIFTDNMFGSAIVGHTQLERALSLAYAAGAADENEACAMKLEYLASLIEPNGPSHATQIESLTDAASAIRARKEKK